MPLFEVAIIEQPEEIKGEKEGKEKLVFGPEPMLAKSPEAAGFQAVRDLDEEVDLDRMEVLVRPFE